MLRTRRLLILVPVAAVAVTLTACDKPEAKVTFQSGSTSVVVGRGDGAELNAKAGSTILIDVPKDIADKQWVAQSLAPDSSGKWSQLTFDGSTSPIMSDTHSVRLSVPHVTGEGSNTYAVAVAQVGKTDDTALWKLAVHVVN